MWADHQPLFYWSTTFGRFRAHLQKRYNVTTFDLAFQRFSRQLFSQQNMLYQYGVRYESGYAVSNVGSMDQHSRLHLPKMIGTNKPRGTLQVQSACCRTFNLSGTICPHGPSHASPREAHDYLHCMARELGPGVVDAMRSRCMVLLTASKWKPRTEGVGDSVGHLQEYRESAPPPPPVQRPAPPPWTPYRPPPVQRPAPWPGQR